MKEKTKFDLPERLFDSEDAKKALQAVISILRKDISYIRDLQDQANYVEEQLALQNRLMHDLDLIDQVKSLYKGNL